MSNGRCDNNCSSICRAVHHKTERGLILLENVSEKVGLTTSTRIYSFSFTQDRFDGRKQMIQVDKSKMLSKNQVTTALRALGTFHGAWWVWLRREKKKAKPEEFVETPMNLEDVENTFIKLRNVGEAMMKPFFAKFHKYLLRLLHYSGCEEDLISRVRIALKTSFWEQTRRAMAIPEMETSQLKTMIHGDFWVNNMMFSSDDPEDEDLTVTLLDFQQLMIAHPSR